MHADTHNLKATNVIYSARNLSALDTNISTKSPSIHSPSHAYLHGRVPLGPYRGGTAQGSATVLQSCNPSSSSGPNRVKRPLDGINDLIICSQDRIFAA
jgi:hypothetical protein